MKKRNLTFVLIALCLTTPAFADDHPSTTSGTSTNSNVNTNTSHSTSSSDQTQLQGQLQLQGQIATGGTGGSVTGNNSSASIGEGANSSTNTTTQGNTQSTTYTSPGSITIRNVPSVDGPDLTSSNDTCMGSTSGSVNIAGLGIGGGSTWVDTNCRRLKNARELWNMGMKGAAMAVMCLDPDNKAALEATGYKCPELQKKEEKSASK